MASNLNFRRPARNGKRPARRSQPAGARAAASHLRPGRGTRRVPMGLRVALNHHAAKSLRAARTSGARPTKGSPRLLRLPRLRTVAPDSWPAPTAQRLVPVSWFNHQWTPRVRVRRPGARPLAALSPQSLTSLRAKLGC